MKKKGFTLIELLAVIVILAIIALIATPIILGIINDAREKANERSVELYASAVRNSIAAYQLTGASAPKSFSDLNVQYDGDVKCTVQELYEDGNFYLDGCKVNNGEREYSYGTKQGTSIEVGKMSICNPLNVQTEGTYTAGDKYECDVDPNKEGYDYTFYVLTTPATGATSVNLIMDSNIRTGGEAVKEANLTDAQKGLVVWISKEDYTREDIGGTETDYGTSGKGDKGPITAIEYLQEATSGWTNTNELTINTFTDVNGNTRSMKEYKANARMPYYSEVSGYDGNNAYLYDNLEIDCRDANTGQEIACNEASYIDGVHNEGITHVLGLSGYWTISATYFDYEIIDILHVSYSGNIRPDSVQGNHGVRPVINLSI